MITILFSPQSKMVKSALSSLLKKLSIERNAFNEVHLDMGTETLISLESECSYLPFGEERKIVVAENFHYLSSEEKRKKYLKGDDASPLLNYFKHPDEDIELYLLVYSSNLDEKCDFYRALKEGNAVFKKVSEFTDQEWDGYMLRYFEKRGVHITHEARSELLRRIKGDYSSFLNEAAKLILYSDGNTLQKEDIELMVTSPLEDSSFALTEALFSGKIGESIQIYRDLRFQGNETIVLIHALATQMREQSLVNHIYQKGMSIDDCASILKVSYWRAKRLMNRAENLNEDRFGKEIVRLYECEKSIMTGLRDADSAFETFLLGFAC